MLLLLLAKSANNMKNIETQVENHVVVLLYEVHFVHRHHAVLIHKNFLLIFKTIYSHLSTKNFWNPKFDEKLFDLFNKFRLEMIRILKKRNKITILISITELYSTRCRIEKKRFSLRIQNVGSMKLPARTVSNV